MSLMGNQTDVNKRHIFVITGRFLKILFKFVLLKSLSISVIRFKEAQDFETEELEEEEKLSLSHNGQRK